jgi:ABC-type sugar transport system permease subunit
MEASNTARQAGASSVRRHGLLGRMWSSRTAYLFIAPFYILFVIFGLFPILFSFYLSFVTWSGFDQLRFVGLGNFRTLFGDDLFWTSLRNTIYLWLGHIFILLIISLFLALILNARWLGLRGLYRAMVYLPNTTATAAVALVFALIFDYHSGVLNNVLGHVGISNINWTGSTDWSKPSIIILNIWNMAGWYMLILLAGLQTIDPQLYEAASIDGANGLQKLRYVTLPGMRRVLFFCFIIETIGSLQIFTEPFILTHGGPENSSLSLAMYLYQNAFEFFRLGYAGAIALVIFLLTVVVSVGQALFWRGEVFAE